MISFTIDENQIPPSGKNPASSALLILPGYPPQSYWQSGKSGRDDFLIILRQAHRGTLGAVYGRQPPGNGSFDIGLMSMGKVNLLYVNFKVTLFP